MSALQDRFAQAQVDVHNLAERPDNNTMLKLYAPYKQATKGDAVGGGRAASTQSPGPSSMPRAK